MTRRTFVGAAAAATTVSGANGRPALLGGAPVRTKRFPSWPRTTSVDEQALMEVLRGGRWYRGSGKTVDRFEASYAKLLGARYCLATANGTSALITALHSLGVRPGDEVIVPPYTFIATVNAVLLHHALPVFVDTDPATFQIDARKIEAAITPRTRVILPVHIGGSAADLDTILATGRRHRIAVLEDACQAHLGEWKGRRLGSLGAAGCFSFQASKNLNSGEGGAMATNDEDLVERAYAYHNNSGARKRSGGFEYLGTGINVRLTEFQAALLLAQMTRLEEQSKLRDENAAHLTSRLREIPGVEPARMYDGNTRSAWHLYMFRYHKEQFAGLPRATFLKALGAEGVPASGGYSPLNKEPFLKNAFQAEVYKKMYPAQRLARWEEQNACPVNDKLCEEAVWFTQTMLLDTREGMDQIAEAILKIKASASELAAKA